MEGIPEIPYKGEVQPFHNDSHAQKGNGYDFILNKEMIAPTPKFFIYYNLNIKAYF